MEKIEHPASEEDLAEAVRSAKSSSTTMAIRGGGTRPIGNPVSADRTVSTTAMNGVTLYEPGALTIIAKAGTSLEEIEETLAEENQHLPFEPANYAGLFGIKSKSTIGGVVAAAASGPRRVQAGACRDSLIGVRFVTGEGEIIKNGGRVMKNVTGYDLVKLMAGSYGTLGVLSEVSFKVLPKPELTGVVSVSGLPDDAAVSALAKALSSPFDVSGAAHLQRNANGDPETLVRVEGFTDSIMYRTQELKKLLASSLPPKSEITIDLDPKTTLARWKDVRDIKPFHDSDHELWRLSVKPSDGPKVIAELSKHLELSAIYDWGGGLVWLQLENVQEDAASRIRSEVQKTGGHATLFRRNGARGPSVESFHPEPSRIAELSRNLRLQFDPAGILNPGLMASVNTNKAVRA